VISENDVVFVFPLSQQVLIVDCVERHQIPSVQKRHLVFGSVFIESQTSSSNMCVAQTLTIQDRCDAKKSAQHNPSGTGIISGWPRVLLLVVQPHFLGEASELRPWIG